MARTVAIGKQNFEVIRKTNCFYIDKTAFIKEWWENQDDVTLITRPRRFGKTLNMSMLEQFFSVKYKGCSDLFEGLFIWKDETYQELQGTYPVISLSFANIKERTYKDVRKKICQLLTDIYVEYSYILKSGILEESEKAYYNRISVEMDDVDATMAIHYMTKFLYRYYGKKVIILLDEYDTPMQEAYVNGYWEELTGFTRSLFNSSFKTNPWMERALMTGITRISKESIFSDLNHLEVITTTSKKYGTSFGFTEQEVFQALDEFSLGAEKQSVKEWYNGFTFGNHSDIYNPWSILNFIDKRKYDVYWANTSSNNLINSLLREGNRRIKEQFEILLKDETIWTLLDEQIVYDQLNLNEEAIWSLLLASGYLKIVQYESLNALAVGNEQKYKLKLTNYEVKRMFEGMVRGWFAKTRADYIDFVKALLSDDLEAMNTYMNRVALTSFSYFDMGKGPFGEEPEKFYHGFVLGMIVELKEIFFITSNRESGFGRYDVILEPKNPAEENAYILEFKVMNPKKEKSLEETVQCALRQIEEKAYKSMLIARGIPEDRIRRYGFAFQGKQVLIG